MTSSSVATVSRSPQASAELRSLLWTTFACWRVSGTQRDDAALVLSELVGNAVRYGHGETVRVALQRDGATLHIAVDDGSAALPVPREVDWDAEGGRGLLIVEALSRRWGTSPREIGKTVWAEVPC